MTEDTKTKEAPETITADDLNLLDPALEDAGKTDEDLWNDLESKETPEGAAKAGEDTGDDLETAEVETKPAEKAGKDETKPDIWANASPEQRAAFEEAQRQVADMEQRLRRSGGSVSGLQRKINSLQEALKAKPGNRDARRDQTATEALGRLKTEYPEIAELLDPVLNSVRGDVTDLSNAERKRVEAATRDLNDSVNELSAIASQNARMVETAHPGYEKYLLENQQKFLAWVEDQPRAIREAAYANAQYVVDAEKAIDVINRFKASITPPAKVPANGAQPAPNPETQSLNDKRQRQLAASASPQGNGNRRPATSGIPEDGDPAAIWAAFEEQERRKSA